MSRTVAFPASAAAREALPLKRAWLMMNAAGETAVLEARRWRCSESWACRFGT